MIALTPVAYILDSGKPIYSCFSVLPDACVRGAGSQDVIFLPSVFSGSSSGLYPERTREGALPGLKRIGF